MPLRIALFYAHYCQYGGFPRDWQRFACELAKLGHDVLVYCYEGPNIPPDYPGVTIRRIDECRHGRFLSVRRFRNVLIGERASLDVLEIVGCYFVDNVVVARVARSLGIPYIYAPLGHLAPNIVARHAIKKRLFIHGLLKNVLSTALAVHVFSETDARWIERLGQWPLIMTRLGAFKDDVPVALDRGYLRARLCVSENTLCVAYMGRLDVFGKGLLELLEGFARASPFVADSRLVLIGPDEKGGRACLAERAHKLGLTNEVTFMGSLGDPAKFHAVASADIFVYPTRYDIVPRAIREAMSVGVPVITTQESHVSEMLVAAGTGARCRCDASSIEVELKRILTDPALLSKMRAEARRVSATVLDWAGQAHAMEQQIKAMLAGD
jgi:glycosyltransferase involved in cell wall biosynthesis